MWLVLEPRSQRRVALTSRQVIWPASEHTDAELVIATRAELDETVVLATPQVLRLAYRVAHVESTLTLGGATPAPWPEPAAVAGRGFEVMLTTRGAIVAPAQGPKLPNRLASWLATLAEDVRCAWPALPDDLRAGAAWSTPPIVPGGLPPGAVSADVTVGYRAPVVTADRAEVQVEFALAAVLERSAPSATAAEGGGTLRLELERRGGPTTARRESELSLVRAGARNQVIRAEMQLARGR